MNCMEFRRSLLTDPAVSDPELEEHRRTCRACAEAVERSAHLERRLREAVNIDVPEGLASRILLRHSFAEPRSTPWWRRGRVYALAASIVLAVALTAVLLVTHVEQRRLSEEFVALVEGAPYALQATDRVSSEQISKALSAAGVDLEGSIGEVTFAGPCIVRGEISGHVVVQGQTSPVTVFIIKEKLVTDRATIRAGRYSGVVVPTGTGTIAIVSAPGEPLAHVEGLVRSAVRWRSSQGA